MNWRTAIVFLVLSLAGCRSGVPERSSVDFAPAVRSFYVGLAAAEVGDDIRAAQELARVTELAPGEPAGWNNLGVLQLRQKDLDSAAKSFERSRSAAADQPVIYLNLAVLENQRGNAEKTVEYLGRTIELAAGDLRAVYLLASEKERQAADAEALALFERISAARPDNIAAVLEIARLAGKTGDAAKLGQAIGRVGTAAPGFSAEAKEQFEALRAASNNPRQAATQVSFLRNVLLREASFRAAIAEFKPSDTAVGELLRRPLKLPVPEFAPA
jgi:Tfp pilus assembly protein PilF